MKLVNTNGYTVVEKVTKENVREALIVALKAHKAVLDNEEYKSTIDKEIERVTLAEEPETLYSYVASLGWKARR